jgi:hypothetical protein
MRTAVAENSIDAFRSLPVGDYLQPKERAVMALFTSLTVRLSRQQISEYLSMPINCVCGRVNSLVAAGHLEEGGDRLDPHTNKRQKLLRLPQGPQRELFHQ